MLNERPLVNHLEGIFLRPVIVHESDDVVSLLLPIEEEDFHAGLNIVREALVALCERPSFDVVELADCLVDCRRGQPRVDPPEAGLEDVDKEDIVVERVGPGNVGPVEVLISESVDHVLDDGLLEELLVEGDGRAPAHFGCPSAHAIVLSRRQMSGDCMLRETTCPGLLPTRHVSIVCNVIREHSEPTVQVLTKHTRGGPHESHYFLPSFKSARAETTFSSFLNVSC